MLTMTAVQRGIYQPIDALEWGKVHQISCQREVSQIINCRHDRSGLLGLSTEKTEFQLRRVSTQQYQASCGEGDTCQYVMLYFETTGQPLAIKDFQGDSDRASLQKVRFEQLLTPTGDSQVTLKYENGAFKNTLLFLIMGGTHFIFFPLILILISYWTSRR